MKKNETSIVCPVCGTSIALAEHEHTVTNATVIGKDSGLGTVYLPVENAGTPKTPSKAEERLRRLAESGVDVSNLFAMRGASGDGMIARMSNGILSLVEEDDPIFKNISDKGVIPDRRLFRRWVMAQTFEMMTARDWRTRKTIGFTEALKRKGYEYQWRMAVEEFRVQAILFEKDIEIFNERNLFFNSRVAYCMCDDYITKFKNYVDGLKRRHCKGIAYKRFNGQDVFEQDIYSKFTYPLVREARAVQSSRNPKELYEAIVRFDKRRVAIHGDVPFCKDWVNAYKGAGAYATLKNLILFHGCTILDQWGVRLSRTQSMEHLESKAKEYRTEGWRLHALMKKTISENGINIEAKRKEWADAKRNR